MPKLTRPGNTVITSISLSKEFNDLIKEYHISPSSAIVKGIAVELYEKGVVRYSSPLNRERLNYVNKFLEDLRNDQEKLSLIKDLKLNANALLQLLSLVESN